MAENPLRRHFESNDGRLIHKLDHYFDIYHRHFAVYRDARPTVVEFGVSQGGSLEMWRDYFGSGARIVGIDINPDCRNFDAGEGVEVLIGDQSDRGFLREVAAEVGPIQVLVDDGGHTMEQLTCTFEEMYPAVAVQAPTTPSSAASAVETAGVCETCGKARPTRLCETPRSPGRS